MLADKYSPSGDGFVTAHWLHDNSTLDIEIIAKEWFKEGETAELNGLPGFVATPPTVVGDNKTKPKKTGAPKKRQIDFEKTGGWWCRGQKPVVLAIKAAHGSSWELNLQTYAADKAQLLCATLGMCTESGKTPHELATAVKKRMEPAIAEAQGPVRGNKVLVNAMRELAKSVRDSILDGEE